MLANESVTMPDGAPVVVAGPRARTTPATVDPSNLMPGVFDALASVTGDARWRGAAATAVTMIGEMTGQGRRHHGRAAVSHLLGGWGAIDPCGSA